MTQLVPSIMVLLMATMRLPTWLKDKRDPVFPAALLALASVTLNIDPLYVPLDGLLGGMNVVNLCVHLLLISALFFLRDALADASLGKALVGKRVALSVYLSVVVLQLGSFLLSDTPETATRFTNTYGDQFAVVVYMATFSLYMVTVFIEVLFAASRYLRTMTGSLKVGFIVVTAAACMSLFSALSQTANVVLRWVPGLEDIADALSSVYKIYQLAGMAFFGIGFSIPPFNTFLARRRDARWLRKAYHQLNPVWDRAVSGTHAASFLPPDNEAELRDRVYRMVVEIRDSELASGGELLDSRDRKTLEEVESGMTVAPAYA